jgi:hypothetical protein
MLKAKIPPADGGTGPATELFTDQTAAAYVGDITARAVRDWRTKRGLPFIRITSKVNRIRKCDLDTWLASHQVAINRRGV